MNILFMCIANSARSQLAEGLAREIFPDAEIQSAGSRPGKLSPFAVQVMKEVGIDISKHYSKSYENLSPKLIVNLSYIITLCDEEVCPVISSQSAKKLHWPFPDPVPKDPMSEDESLRHFRIARDGIKSKLLEFKKELGQ